MAIFLFILSKSTGRMVNYKDKKSNNFEENTYEISYWLSDN